MSRRPTWWHSWFLGSGFHAWLFALHGVYYKPASQVNTDFSAQWFTNKDGAHLHVQPLNKNVLTFHVYTSTHLITAQSSRCQSWVIHDFPKLLVLCAIDVSASMTGVASVSLSASESLGTRVRHSPGVRHSRNVRRSLGIRHSPMTAPIKVKNADPAMEPSPISTSVDSVTDAARRTVGC